MKVDNEHGKVLFSWVKDLFPICRSITGPGVRETLLYLKEIVPELEIHSVASGTQVYDWEVPDEWVIRDAYVEDESGNKVIDFKNNNLHLVGYSESIDQWMSLGELEEHLFSLEDQPTAIPYVTSYYSRCWGFCLSHEQKLSLEDKQYHVIIDSEFKKGVMNYGEIVMKGESSEEILLSTYICHPSMANNELSGPIVTTGIAKWLSTLKKRRYTYRIVFVPETIGSITYISQHEKHLKKYTVAGFVVTCIGDDRAYSYLPSRKGNTLADHASEYILNHYIQKFDRYSYLERGSDERQYCSPNIDLPVCSVMRSKYGTYPEYHTSLDDLSLVSPDGLQGGFDMLKKILELLEFNYTYINKINCEPKLSKHGLYPTISVKNNCEYDEANLMLNFLSYADGDSDLLQISILIEEDFFIVHEIAQKLLAHGIVEIQ